MQSQISHVWFCGARARQNRKIWTLVEKNSDAPDAWKLVEITYFTNDDDLQIFKRQYFWSICELEFTFFGVRA